MTNKKLYCEDVLQMLLADSDSEGKYLRFANDDWPSNARASPVTSLLRNGAAGHGESVHKAQTSDNFGPLLNGDGGGRGGRGLSDHRRGSVLLMITTDWVFFSDRVCSKCRRQTVQVQSVLGNIRSVRCAMQWEVPYSQELQTVTQIPDWADSWSTDQKIGTCILLWHSNIVIIYYFLRFYYYFLFS